MGFQDRDYNRDASQAGGVQMPQTMVGMIVLVNVVIFGIDALWTTGRDSFGYSIHPLNNLLSLPSDIISRPWALLTYGFTHASLDHPRGIMHILLNMYSLWLFGRDVERVYGSKEFLRIYLLLVVLSGLVWALFTQISGAGGTLVGASGAVAGILVLFALHFPQRQFVMFPIPFQVRAWFLCVMLIVINILGVAGHGAQDVAYMAHLTGVAAAFLYYRSGIRFSRMLPGLSLPTALSGKPKLKVHKPSRRDEKLESQADAILQKVHQHGADSISAKERRILDEYSRSVREKCGQVAIAGLSESSVSCRGCSC